MGGAGRKLTLAVLLALGSGCAAVDPGASGTGVRPDGFAPVSAPSGARAPAKGGDPDTEGFAIGFDDQRAPKVFEAELTARRDKAGGTQGLWATVSGLGRAERAEVVNLATGATAQVALFNGPVKRGEARISNAAAVLLGIGAEPARVRIVALRSEPVIVAP
jgi:hypothetical protein